MMMTLDRTLSVAPMMGCTDRHCRYLLRLLAPNTLLYTEMVVTGALIHGETAKFLTHTSDEPVALQIGGSNPTELRHCAVLAEEAGYQEVNLNVGCPSDRVQYGGIGACLMAEPALVAECIAEMQAAVNIPVTVKSRIGIDDHHSYEAFEHFIDTVAGSGCRTFIIHARKAILSGLSPKENREIPPLRYDYVYRIRDAYPDCQFILNGGLRGVDDTIAELDRVAGVMLGRAPYADPWLLAELEQAIYGTPVPDRLDILSKYRNYVDQNVRAGVHFKHMGRHLLGYFTGCRGAQTFRRHLSERMFKENVSASLIDEALVVSGLDQPEALQRTGT